MKLNDEASKKKEKVLSMKHVSLIKQNSKSSLLECATDQRPIKGCTLLTDQLTLAFYDGGYYVYNKQTLQSRVECSETVYHRCHHYPWVVTVEGHKNTLRIYNAELQAMSMLQWEELSEEKGKIMGVATNGNDLAVVTTMGVECYRLVSKEQRPISLNPTGFISAPLKMKLHVSKFEGDLLVYMVNDTVSIFNMAEMNKVTENTSKDGYYFLFAAIEENNVFCATSSFLYVFTFVNLGTVTEVIIPLSSPVSYLLPHKERIFCGCFDGIVRVYDYKLMGTHIYNVQEITAPEARVSPDDSNIPSFRTRRSSLEMSQSKPLKTQDRVVFMFAFNNYLIITDRNGSCGIWGLYLKYQQRPLINFSLEKHFFVSHIMMNSAWGRGCSGGGVAVVPPVGGSEGLKISLLIRDEKMSKMFNTQWEPDFTKLEQLLAQNMLSKFIVKPKTGRKAVMAEWKSYTKDTQEDEFVETIQALAEKEYPTLMNCCQSCTITNNTLPDNPIVFVNDEFSKMTGYLREEIIGQNCRFLQGKYTDSATVKQISTYLREGKSISAQILNYRKDGTPFWNVFVVLPVHDKKGKIPAFVAIQKNITKIKLREKHINEWRFCETALWLESIGLGVYSQIFFARRIDGRILSQSSPESLKELGVSATDAVLIQNELKKLQEIPVDGFRAFCMKNPQEKKQKQKQKQPTTTTTTTTTTVVLGNNSGGGGGGGKNKIRRSFSQSSLNSESLVESSLDESDTCREAKSNTERSTLKAKS